MVCKYCLIVIEATQEDGQFDADIYIDALREDMFADSPDISKAKIRRDYREKPINTYPRVKSEKDEEYPKYAEDTRYNAKMPSKSKNI